MATYQHILFAADLSTHCEALATKAKTLAHSMGAQLSLVHVIEQSPMIYGSGEFAVPIDVELEESIKQEASDAMETLGVKLGISAEQCHIAMGSRKDEIVKLANETNCDLIIVGAHDKHGLSLLLGSTADTIIHALPCDVLALKVEESESESEPESNS